MAFGVEADLLADLVLRGEKTATASAYPLYDTKQKGESYALIFLYTKGL